MPSANLATKLKKADVAIQKYVLALEAENVKLHEQIAELEVKNLSAHNRIAALKKGEPEPYNEKDFVNSLEAAAAALREHGYTVTKKRK